MHSWYSKIQVNIDCEPHRMIAHVQSNTIFQGKLYTRERPATCGIDVSSSMQFSLPISLKGDQCATIAEVSSIQID